MSNNLGSLGLILTLASIVTPAGAIAQEEGKEYTIVNAQSGRLLDADLGTIQDDGTKVQVFN